MLTTGLCSCQDDGLPGPAGAGGSGDAGVVTGAGGSGSGGRAGSGGKPGSGGNSGSGGTNGSGGKGGSGGATGGGGATGSGGGSSADATIVPDPSWACGAPDGIPPPTHGELVFEATIQLGAIHDGGATPYGHRRLLDVKSSTITSTRLNATVVGGSEELELTLSSGSVELEGLYMLRASNGASIYLRTCGVAPAG